MRRSSPLARLSQRVHAAPARGGLTGLIQRMAVAVLPSPGPVPPVSMITAAAHLPPPPTPEQSAARDRARRALIEARRTMRGVIGDEPAQVTPDDAALAAVTPDLDRLQNYLEDSERERAVIIEEMAELRETIRRLQSRLDGLERMLPAPAGPEAAAAIDQVSQEPEGRAATDREPEPAVDAVVAEVAAGGPIVQPDGGSAAAGMTPADAADEVRVQAMRERVLRALRERVFAAGTVGTRIQVEPAPAEPVFAEMIERFNDDPLVEHAEPVEAGDQDPVALVRVTLRAPLRWEQFGPLLERALGLPIAQQDVHWAKGAVHVRLPSGPEADDTEQPRKPVEPCA